MEVLLVKLARKMIISYLMESVTSVRKYWVCGMVSDDLLYARIRRTVLVSVNTHVKPPIPSRHPDLLAYELSQASAAQAKHNVIDPMMICIQARGPLRNLIASTKGKWGPSQCAQD